MDIFDALATDSRRQILQRLLNGPCAVSDIVAQTAMSQPVVSKHLKILRDADLVRVQPQGQQRLYQLNPAPLMALDEWLMPYRQFWSERFDALAAHLDANQKPMEPDE